MPVKNPFSYSARWDSAGIECSFCKNVRGEGWPNKDGKYWCHKHSVSLRIEIAKTGYKEGEWFCIDFVDDGRAYSKALEEFAAAKQSLEKAVLYRCRKDEEFLEEVNMNKLPKV